MCKFKDDNRPYAVKVIKKASLTDSKLVEGSQTENFILRTMRHPFMVGLEFAFQDVNRLYLVMDFINGGELFYHLSKKGRFAEEQSCFHGAQILSALQCLHGKGIVYR